MGPPTFHLNITCYTHAHTRTRDKCTIHVTARTRLVYVPAGRLAPRCSRWSLCGKRASCVCVGSGAGAAGVVVRRATFDARLYMPPPSRVCVSVCVCILSTLRTHSCDRAVRSLAGWLVCVLVFFVPSEFRACSRREARATNDG